MNSQIQTRLVAYNQYLLPSLISVNSRTKLFQCMEYALTCNVHFMLMKLNINNNNNNNNNNNKNMLFKIMQSPTCGEELFTYALTPRRKVLM
jgi:hypothetical protein